MALHGVDLSAYQPNCNWPQVRQSGLVDFVYSKASEGTGYVSDAFAHHHDGCKTVGIPFGAYHFFQFAQDPYVQAEHFLSAISGLEGQLLPMVDVEAGSMEGVSLHSLSFVKLLGTFTAIVEDELRLGKMLIYTGWDFWNSQMEGTDAFSGHPLWVAAYGSPPAPVPNGFHTVTIWQNTDSYHVPGIGIVDGDELLVPLSTITRPQ